MSKVFVLLGDKIKKGKIVVLFDEISWMGSKDPDFLGKLKNVWDLHFFSLDRKNILSNTGFLGRISYRLTVEELPLSDCNQFWPNSEQTSAYRYLEEIKSSLTAEENIKDLCFVKGGPLVNEFTDIFSELFSRRSQTYKKIIKALAEKPLEIKKICKILAIQRTGFISEYLYNLIKSGFLTGDYTWDIKSGQLSRLSHYRLSDNYLRFYLKYIEKIYRRYNIMNTF